MDTVVKSNVVPFPKAKRYNKVDNDNLDEVLDSCKGKFIRFVIVGETIDGAGSTYEWGGEMTVAQANYLLDMAKNALFTTHIEE